MIDSAITLIFLLVSGHFFVDFAVQNQFVAQYKCRSPKKLLTDEDHSLTIWPWVLTAHSFHHGLAVYLITQNLTLGVLETVVHWLIDYAKCEHWFNFHMDQILHILTKFIWFGLLYYSIV